MQKPRETSHTFASKAGGCTQELYVKLNLHKVSMSGGKKTAAAPQSSPSTPLQKSFKKNPSSPQLSGVWASRASIQPMNWSKQVPTTTAATEPRRSREHPVTFAIGGSQTSTPTDSLQSESSDTKVLLRTNRPQNRMASQLNPNQRPFHHSVSGPLDPRPPSSSYQPKTRPHSDIYSRSTYHHPSSTSDGSSQGSSSRDSTLNESHDSSKEVSWSKVVSRKNRLGSGSGSGNGSGQYQRSQSTTHAHQQSAGRGQRGRDGGWSRGGAGGGGGRKPYSEPSRNKYHN